MSREQSRRVIGGDFELDQLSLAPVEQLDRLTRGLKGRWTTSGRGALALVLKELRHRGVRHVHLPAYLCESVIQPVRALGFDFSFYPVDLSLTAQPDPPAGACLLVIHYFGWMNRAVDSLRTQVSPKFPLIEDAVQALLSDWSAPENESRFVILSPRKFGPAILGGWCSVAGTEDDEAVEKVPGEVGPVIWRGLAARLARGAYLRDAEGAIEERVEDFYLAALGAVEKFLDQHPTHASVPRLVLEQMAGVDWERVARRRRENWLQLRELLAGRVEALHHELPEGVVPLGYLVALKERDRVRAALAAERIFCPVHWPLPREVERRNFPAAAALSETCLTLPVDQRYGPEEMSRLAEALLAAL
jgi:hypothetical protein